MGIFDKLFGGGKKKVSRETADERGVHMPELDIPIDEKFTIHFKKNGGKFLYCDSTDEIFETLQHIITENDWSAANFFSFDENIKSQFSKASLNFTDKVRNADVFFTTCEHLIGQNGSILICSHQLKDCKLNEVPKNFIVYATTSQLVGSIGEGLTNIKKKYNNIPTNITTIKHFSNKELAEDDFLSYGSSTKNVYLLLLEDL